MESYPEIIMIFCTSIAISIYQTSTAYWLKIP